MKDKINIKTQKYPSMRGTSYKEGFNCVNLFLGNFQVGLNVREWGSQEDIEPKITFRIEGKEYRFNLDELKNKLKGLKK